MKYIDPTVFTTWHYSRKASVNLSSYDISSLTIFFRRIISYLENNDARLSIFVSDIFWSLVGLNYLDYSIEDDDKDIINRFVTECWTGKGFATTSKLSPYNKVLVNQSLPEDVYSTYYCIGILTLIDHDVEVYLEKISDIVLSWFQPSGWVYNSEWSVTNVQRRLDIELFQQELMGLRIADLLNMKPKELPYHDERLKNLHDYIENPRYISSLFYAVLCLQLIGMWGQSREKYKKRIIDFVISHNSEEEKGFKEYLFENVKLFSYRGMGEDEKGATARHRFQSDFVVSSINATTYSLWLGLEGIQDDLLNFLKSKRESIIEFYMEQKSLNGGFGTPIKIAKYTASFGPVVTPMETCNHIIGSSLAFLL